MHDHGLLQGDEDMIVGWGDDPLVPIRVWLLRLQPAFRAPVRGLVDLDARQVLEGRRPGSSQVERLTERAELLDDML